MEKIPPLESLEMNPEFWKNKSVFVTGHTGFKGGWLSLWLNSLGANVHGYSLEPTEKRNLFTLAGVNKNMKSSTIANILDYEKLKNTIKFVNPDIVFHLAAQPFVPYSYKFPLETYAVNVMGVANLFESLRASLNIRAIVNVTTDKCYLNKESKTPYLEDDNLGGFDPYSSSKACSELVTLAYQKSFFSHQDIGVASARAGNVFGGGDFARNRLVPDFFSAAENGSTLMVRSIESVRPWQHVLEPLSGYLKLAEALYKDPGLYSGAWNFGPAVYQDQTVGMVLNMLSLYIKNVKWIADPSNNLTETKHLMINSSKALRLLNWKSKWDLNYSLSKSADWFNAFNDKKDLNKICLDQIYEYQL